MKNFENDNYSAEATEEGGCRLSVKVFVKPQAAQKAYKQAIKVVNKQISVPGFRKGHAPDKTVVSRYSSYIEQEWKEIIVGDAYRAAVEFTDIYPTSKESIDKPKIESCSQEDGAVVLIAYEHYPIVPEVEFSKIKLPSIKQEKVSDDKVDEIVEEVRRTHATYEDVEGRAVKKGDHVDVDIDSLEEETPKELVRDRRFEVDEKKLAPWLVKLIVGLKVGESNEGTSELDSKADEVAKRNFKPTNIRITLKAIKKMVLPEIDDELAKKTGAESVEDLKNKIRHNLEREAELNLKDKKIAAIDEALLETYSFELPASLIDAERRERLKRRLEALKSENISDEEIRSQENAIAKEVNAEIDRDIRLYFINKQIAKQGKISLTNQELNDELMRYMSQNPYLYSKDRNDEEVREIASRMASAMMQRKTKDYALSQVEGA